MKKNLVLIICCFLLSVAQAQKNKFYEGTILLADNSQKKGLVKLPSEADDKAIDFKASENAGKEAIKSEAIQSFRIKAGSEEVEFVYTRYYNIGSNKLSKSPGWFNILRRGPVTLYSNNYDVFSPYELSNAAASHGIYFLLKRDSEEAPAAVGMYFPSSVNHNQIFRKFAAKYFTDYPELANRLNEKEFKLEDVGKVADIYNEWKGKGK